MFQPPSTYGILPYGRTPPIIAAERAAGIIPPEDDGWDHYRYLTGQHLPDDPRVLAEPAKGFGTYNSDVQMGPAYEASLGGDPYGIPSVYTSMPDLGTPEYEKMMYGNKDGVNPNTQLPKFDPYSGADWARGLGLFAKGALFGAPKEAGPANTTSKSGNNVSKESTFDQKDYWGWLFNS
jgi:hypothetical protein